MTGKYNNSNQITRAGVRWAIWIIVTAIIAAWGIGYTVSATNVQRREAAIKDNTIAISNTRAEVAAMASDVKSIKESVNLLLGAFRIVPKDKE